VLPQAELQIPLGRWWTAKPYVAAGLGRTFNASATVEGLPGGEEGWHGGPNGNISLLTYHWLDFATFPRFKVKHIPFVLLIPSRLDDFEHF
jgi:hypothetical protein